MSLRRPDLLAAMAYNVKRGLPGDEHYALLVAFAQESAGLTVDGKMGPATSALLDRAGEAALAPPPVSLYLGTAGDYPRNYADRERVLGTPGDERSLWYRTHVVERQGDRAFPGVPRRWYVKVHALVEPYAQEAFRRAAASSSYRIERCGSYVYRRVRKRATGRLSSHAFAAAFDVDASRNALLDEDDIGETLPVPFTAAWRELYPHGVDAAFVRAFESCGFRWGGTYHLHGLDYTDPMHFEWVGLPSFYHAIRAA